MDQGFISPGINRGYGTAEKHAIGFHQAVMSNYQAGENGNIQRLIFQNMVDLDTEEKDFMVEVGEVVDLFVDRFFLVGEGIVIKEGVLRGSASSFSSHRYTPFYNA
jgi:hypothetical protein